MGQQLVTLLRETEHVCACAEIQRACAQLGLRWLHAPLDGLKDIKELTEDDTSLDPGLESLSSAHEVLEWILRDGESVIVHCAAGLHRTGVFLYLLLRLAGRSSSETLQGIFEIREETHEQVKHLHLDTQAERILKKFED